MAFLFIACLVLSFLLSGMEAGVFALSRLRIHQQARAGRPSARVLLDFLEQPERFLWTILVGNTLANLIILGGLVMFLHAGLEGHRAWFAAIYVLAVFLFYALFDLLPKMLFRTFPNRLCLYLARPFRLLYLLLRPPVALVEWVSGLLLRWRGGKVFTGHLFGNRQELRLVMQESAQALSSEERSMINRVLDFQSLTVRSIMIPTDRVVTVRSETLVADVLKLAAERKLSRLPLVELRDGQPRIRGLINISLLLYSSDLDPAGPAGKFVQPAIYLEEDLRLELALRRFQRSGQRLAIVLSRDRREIGILSLQDILKVLFEGVSP